jgi:hypothetical protein
MNAVTNFRFPNKTEIFLLAELLSAYLVVPQLRRLVTGFSPHTPISLPVSMHRRSILTHVSSGG